jgi:hypothetical protein
MDKKELNDLIDRVVLTGPGGVDKIKKILKELANDSGSGSGSGGSVSPSPMIVRGTYDDLAGAFTPDEGYPTWAEAREHFLSGGSLIIEYPDSYHPTDKVMCAVTAYWYPSLVTKMFEWIDPDVPESTPK